MIKKYVYLLKRRLADQEFETEKTLSKVMFVLKGLLGCLLYVVFGLGFAIGFIKGAGTIPSDVLVVCGIFAFPILDFIEKLFFRKRVNTEIPVFYVLPVKKKAAITCNFVHNMCTPLNLGLLFFLLPLFFVPNTFGIAETIMLLLLMLVYAVANTAVVDNIKQFFFNRKYIKALLLTLIYVAVCVAGFFLSKAMARWTFGPSTPVLVIGIVLLETVLLTIVSWLFFYFANKYPVQELSNEKFSFKFSLGNSAYSIMFHQILRTPAIKRNFFSLFLSGLCLPLMLAYFPFNNPVLAKFSDVFLFFPFLVPTFFVFQTFSSESMFMDRLMTVKSDFLFSLLLARYRTAIAAIVFMYIVLVVFIPEPNYLLLTAVALIVIGPVTVFYFYSAAFYAFHWDIMQSKMPIVFNFFDIFFVLGIGFLGAAGYALVKYVSMEFFCAVYSAVGFFFAATHKYWLKKVFNTFLRRRYLLLDKYRRLD